MPLSIASPSTRPSPLFRRVGIHIFTFEACSGFTHVTARWIAQPPKAAFVTRLRPGQSPSQTARQLPDQSTTLWVESSSTGETRLRGAQNKQRIHSCGQRGYCAPGTFDRNTGIRFVPAEPCFDRERGFKSSSNATTKSGTIYPSANRAPADGWSTQVKRASDNIASLEPGARPSSARDAGQIPVPHGEVPLDQAGEDREADPLDRYREARHIADENSPYVIAMPCRRAITPSFPSIEDRSVNIPRVNR